MGFFTSHVAVQTKVVLQFHVPHTHVLCCTSKTLFLCCIADLWSAVCAVYLSADLTVLQGIAGLIHRAPRHPSDKLTMQQMAQQC